MAIPLVVGEIIAGIIVGKSGLNLVHEGPILRSLSTLGFAYLMFLSGLEIDFDNIFSGRDQKEGSRWFQALNNPFVTGSFVFTLTLIGSMLAALVLWDRELVSDPWIMALILSTTSLGIVVPVLKERNLSGNKYGQLILVSSLIADFGSILLISIYVLLRSRGLTGEILLVLLLFAAFLVTHRLAILFQKHLPTERFIAELPSTTSQIKLRGSFALALVFIALAESLGIEIILGAFLAGVIISLLSKKDDSIYFEKIDAIGYGFLIPIFFIMVGVGFDLQALLNSGSAMLLVFILIIIAFAVKLIPSLIYRYLFSWRETLAAGLLLSSRLSLIIAAAAIGLELGLISSAVNSAVILIAILSCTISPILFNRLIAVRNDDQERVIVIGSPEKGELVTQRLVKHDLEAVLVDLHNGYENPTGNSDQYISSQEGLLDHLRSVNLETAQTIIALDDDDETNLRIARIAHHTFGLENIISWVTDPLQNPRFRRLGVRVLNPGFSNVLITESMVLNPDVYSVVSDVDETQEVREVKLQNPEMLNQSISEINLPEGVNVIMIERQGNLLVPEQKTVLRANDTITLVGKDIEEAVRSFVRES